MLRTLDEQLRRKRWPMHLLAKVIKPTTFAGEAVPAHAIASDNLPPLASLDEFHCDLIS
jgi:hypothetical protein